MRKERYEYACSRCGNNCWGCFYAEECPVWNDQQDAAPTQIPATEVYMSLCEGRHEIPQAIDGSIFGTELDPLDLSGMEREATEQFLTCSAILLTDSKSPGEEIAKPASIISPPRRSS